MFTDKMPGLVPFENTNEVKCELCRENLFKTLVPSEQNSWEDNEFVDNKDNQSNTQPVQGSRRNSVTNDSIDDFVRKTQQ